MQFILLILCAWSITIHSQEQWETTELLWNFNFIIESDKGLTLSPEQYFHHWFIPFDPDAYRNIHSGDLVWVQACHITQFYKHILPLTKNPFVLIINDGDEAFPSSCQHSFDVESLIEHPHILHIFAQNCDYQGSSKKVSPLPIGIDFHSVAYKLGMWGETGSPREQELRLKNLLATLHPTFLRKKRAFVDFQHNDSMRADPRHGTENRTTIFNQLKKTGLIDYGPFMARSTLWKKKGAYAFSISPHGRGLDCHRTWEDLALGCIVIVKTSPLDPLYEGLPVVIVQDWKEVTAENLDKWLIRYHDAFTNLAYREKLTNAYWLNKLRLIASSIPTTSNQ